MVSAGADPAYTPAALPEDVDSDEPAPLAGTGARRIAYRETKRRPRRIVEGRGSVPEQTIRLVSDLVFVPGRARAAPDRLPGAGGRARGTAHAAGPDARRRQGPAPRWLSARTTQPSPPPPRRRSRAPRPRRSRGSSPCSRAPATAPSPRCCSVRARRPHRPRRPRARRPPRRRRPPRASASCARSIATCSEAPSSGSRTRRR